MAVPSLGPTYPQAWASYPQGMGSYPQDTHSRTYCKRSGYVSFIAQKPNLYLVPPRGGKDNPFPIVLAQF